MQTIIQHHILGEITVSQTLRAKRISISVRPPGKIRLSIPYNVPLSEAMKFVDSKIEWIKKSIAKYSALQTEDIISMPYSTRRHSLELLPEHTDKVKVGIRQGKIKVRYPLEVNYASEEVQLAIKRGIEEAWRIEAKELLPVRLREIAEQTGFKYRSVTIRNTVSKWGSCSVKNDISLSLHLMRLPDHLIDYILIHELCHTVHKNHGPKFHKLLDSFYGGKHRVFSKELKSFHPRW